MAAPPSATMGNLAGTWVMGMPWIIRKAVSFATITGKLTQTKDGDGVTCVQIAQTASGGIKGETKIQRLNGTRRLRF